jgi:hypothetical protein
MLLSARYLFIRISFYLFIFTGRVMKIFVAGVERIAGTSKAGSPFDMCNLHALVPVEPMQNAKITIQGSGLKSMDIPLANEALAQFLPLASKMPCWMDVTTEPRPRNGKFETVVVDLVGVVGLAKAA